MRSPKGRDIADSDGDESPGRHDRVWAFYVVYDISDDRLREKVANILIYYGLCRVQYSSFQGVMDTCSAKELLERLRLFELEERDSIHIIHLCPRCARAVHILGREVSRKEHIVL